MAISICITTYNRVEETIRSFINVLDDERIDDIVIVDDKSDLVYFNDLAEKIIDLNNDKVNLSRNEINIDCYFNKREALRLAKNKWCIILDSDNQINKDYIDRLFEIQPDWHDKIIYAPSFAKPHFNFQHIAGKLIDKTNIAELIEHGNTETMLNAMNYFVNRDEYLKAFDDTIDPVTSDSLYQNYRMLLNGNSIFVVPGLEYNHPISEDSHYKKNVKRTPKGFHESIIQKLKEMK